MSSSRDYYDALAMSYSEVSKSRSSYLTAIDQLVYRSILIAKPKKLLDIGSGDGKRIFKLTDNTGTEIWALENSIEMCAILSRTIPKSRIFESDISRLSEVTETFDSITALWNVFGHIEFIESTFVEIKEKLNPGGTFIFDVNNALNVGEYGIISMMRNYWKFCLRREKLTFSLNREDVSTNVYFRPLGWYKSELKRAGFSVIRVKFINYTTGQKTSRFRGQFYFECITS